MKYSELVEVYDALAGTTKRLEKAVILAEFMKKYVKKGQNDWVYLLLGRVFPEYDTQETGISRQLTLKAIAKSFGVDEAKVQDKFTKLGDFCGGFPTITAPSFTSEPILSSNSGVMVSIAGKTSIR